ncbi:MAG: glutamine synthetase family protein [Ardenticatenaceae bacterium]|nr:glutamine synthetase family protein [Ardenticatenaceae bacterium]HBY95845.1 glutamine synthetase [Chloroflexota bacterium]
MKLTDIRDLIQTGDVEFIRFEQSDTHGIARSKTVPARHFERFAEQGLNFLLGQLGFDAQAGVAPGTGYLEELGFPDSRIKPDLDTFHLVPWTTKTGRVLCEPSFIDGRPAMAAPRLVARKLLDELEAMGYRLLSGFEYEFYLVDAATHEPPFPGIQIFATLRNNFNEALVYDILRGMEAVGVDIITSNAEYGPGQMEINFAPEWGITAADNAFTFKNGVKEIAQQHRMMASFMTKPFIDRSANGCHYHQSLWQEGKNVFVDTSCEDGISEICRHYLAGQIAHAAALSALAAPTVNCAKRYRLYSFAPTNATWGFENRTTGWRVKATRDESTHIENRLGGGASNPYVLMAASVAAGIDGLKNKMELPAPVSGVAYGMSDVTDLPTRLDDALDALDQDPVLKEMLGPEFIQLFTAVKRHEIGKANAAIEDYGTPEFYNRVDEWERSEYFEFL